MNIPKIEEAITLLYQTFIEDQDVATQRGIAITAMNEMVRLLGGVDVVAKIESVPYSARLRAQHLFEDDPSQRTKQEIEAKPVARNECGRITWIVDDWPQNCLLYTYPPKSFTYEQVKAHIRAASMSANEISVGSDVTNDGVSIVIRRRDEILYAEFFAHPPHRTWVGLTDEDDIDWEEGGNLKDLVKAIEAKLKEKNT